MCNEESSAKWSRLVPDLSGSYVNGNWLPVPNMIDARALFPAAVLADGRLLVCGGEYGYDQSGTWASIDLAKVEVYEGGQWTELPIPRCPDGTPWAHIGDVPCCVLPNGRFLLGYIATTAAGECQTATALFDPATNTWSPGASKSNPSGEETWTLLAEGTVLTVDCYQPNFQPAPGSTYVNNTSPPVAGVNAAVKYVASSNQWVSAGALPVPLVQIETPTWFEIGPRSPFLMDGPLPLAPTGAPQYIRLAPTLHRRVAGRSDRSFRRRQYPPARRSGWELPMPPHVCCPTGT